MDNINDYQQNNQFQPYSGNNYVSQPPQENSNNGGHSPKNHSVIITVIICATLIILTCIITAVVFLNKKQPTPTSTKVFVFTEYEDTIDDMEKAFRTKDGRVPQKKEKEVIQKEYTYVQKDNEENHLFKSVKIEYNPCQLVCTLDDGRVYYHIVNDTSCIKDNSGEVIEAESAPESTAKSQEQPEIDYSEFEDALNEYAYGYIGGWMKFAYHNQKIYFADSEYNTAKVLYFDMGDSHVHTLASDNNNPMSGPCTLSNTSAIVLSSQYNNEPWDVDWSQAKYHIYDFDSDEIIVLDNNFEVDSLLSYENGKVYGADDTCIYVANADGSNVERLSFYADYPHNWQIYNYKSNMYVCYCIERDSDNEDKVILDYHLAKLNGNNIDTLFDTDSNVFFADNLCYYAKTEGEESEIYCYDLETGEETSICKVEKTSNIYCVLGDRIYYEAPVENDNYEIAIKYYDTSLDTVQEISRNVPVLGGW